MTSNNYCLVCSESVIVPIKGGRVEFLQTGLKLSIIGKHIYYYYFLAITSVTMLDTPLGLS